MNLEQPEAATPQGLLLAAPPEVVRAVALAVSLVSQTTAGEATNPQWNGRSSGWKLSNRPYAKAALLRRI